MEREQKLRFEEEEYIKALIPLLGAFTSSSHGEDIQDLMCPICSKILDDPVQVEGSVETYDRNCIQRTLESDRKSSFPTENQAHSGETVDFCLKENVHARELLAWWKNAVTTSDFHKEEKGGRNGAEIDSKRGEGGEGGGGFEPSVTLKTATGLLERGVSEGHPKAQFVMGVSCEFGNGIMQDVVKASQFDKSILKEGLLAAHCIANTCCKIGLPVPANLRRAIEIHKKKGNYDLENLRGGKLKHGEEKAKQEYVEVVNEKQEQESAGAESKTKLCSENEMGGLKDLQKAVEWYRKAAEQGHAGAQEALGYCYEYGNGLPHDFEQAVEWYRKGAEQGQAGCQHKLGLCYANGYGIPQDYEQAMSWYMKAGEQGYAGSQRNIGYLYQRGIGCVKDLAMAAAWFRKAAMQGDAGGQCALGYCYQNGIGVNKDFTQAVRWYKKAAEKEDAKAQKNLGFCYQTGMGVRRDMSECAKWYLKAAEQGNREAQYYLGSCFISGKGVKKSREKAVEWFSKAAEQGHPNAQRLLEEMQPSRASREETG